MLFFFIFVIGDIYNLGLASGRRTHISVSTVSFSANDQLSNALVPLFPSKPPLRHDFLPVTATKSDFNHLQHPTCPSPLVCVSQSPLVLCVHGQHM